MTTNFSLIDSILKDVFSKKIDRSEVIRQFEALSDDEKEQFLGKVRLGSLTNSVETQAIAGTGVIDDDRQREASAEPLIFQEYWQEVPLDASETEVDIHASHTHRTIVFSDENWLNEPVADATAGLGDVIYIVRGDRFQKLSDRVYCCRANDEVQLQTLFRRLVGEADKASSIVYAWSKGKGEVGIHELFTLFKAVKPFASQICQLTLLGHYDYQSPNSCWDYAWIGFQRSWKPHYPATVISLVYSESISIGLKQAIALSSRGSVVWLRGEQAYRLSVRGVDVARNAQVAALKQYGGYLITGGVGALGFTFASHLASHYQAKLILVGRRPLSDAIREQLDKLKQLGAREAVYEAVDVCDEQGLTSLAHRLPFELAGVIHAAGIESDKAFFEKSAADVRQVMGPKTIGTLLLDQVLGQQPLDFVCYFSSSAALLGDFGGCDYAIANRFQMGYGDHREQNARFRGKTIVVNWPLWDGAEGGMGARNKERADFYLKTSGQKALSARYGVPLWCDLVQAGSTQSLVMIGDARRVTSTLQRFYENIPNRQFALSPDQPVVVDPQANAAKTTDVPDDELKAIVGTDLKRLISAGYKIAIDRLEESVHLAEYGLDSINLTELAQQLTAHFMIEITPALFFSYISIDQLSDYFVSQHRDHLQAFYRPAPAAGRREDADPSQAVAGDPIESRSARQDHASDQNGTRRQEPVAIIGMAGRFPNADTVDELWALLSDGKSAITDIPESRWNWRDYFTVPGDPENEITTNQGGFIRDIGRFDALFFDISPREAQDMDPAQQLLLMESYRAIEDAGLSPQSIRGSRTAVFVGMEESQHEMLNGWRGITTGGAAMIASRLSYFLDLHGPAIVTNTACSSGLVALHQAVMSLRQGECDTALVASVALTLSPHSYITMSRAGMLSPDGQCRSFAANANGIGVGEAVVVLMLKPLAAAIADGNPVHGVLRASGINFDGKTNGVTAPNGKMQAELIERIYTDHKIDINDLGHIVAHGTGTKLGDPVEVNALHDAFKRLRARQPDLKTGRSDCAITSCKANLGHTMAASGLVSVVSLLQSIRHRQIPASLHCEEENPHFNRTDASLYVNRTRREWQRMADRPRMGAVSAFGRSGTNAHVVIEEYLPAENIPGSGSGRSPHAEVAIALSARTAEQLRQKVRDLLHFTDRLEADGGDENKVRLTDVAYTLQTGREAMAYRLGLIAGSFGALQVKLRAYLDDAKDIGNLFRGDAKSDPHHVRALVRDRETVAAATEWLAAKRLPELLELWVKGFNLDWQRLYGDDRPRRISLPAYPFTGEVYRQWNAPESRISAARRVDRNDAFGRGKAILPSPSGKSAVASGKSPLVVIGGAGLFGLCMGVFLKKANIPFTIIEKNEDVGGVWFVNRWPGCGCDIPMLAYAYSFEHFTGDIWAKQPDILRYLQGIAQKYDLYSHITFNTKIREASWQEETGQWLLTFENEETIAAKYYIHAANEGQGHVGNIPNIPGMDEFQGSLMHALDCQAEDWDFAGKRIAIIGNGTTQIQLVETLQPVAGRLVVYARSPKYIYPRATYGSKTQEKLGSDYQFWLKHRGEYLAGADEFYAISNDPVQINPFHPDTQVERYFSRDMTDDWRSFYQWLREIDMVPDYSPGCSRPCMSHTYHHQIRADNVELKTVPAARITATGIETEKDAEAFDIILLATGYDLHDFKPRITIRGRNRLELNEYFGDFPKSHAGIAVPHFPNFFLASGPNSGSNVTSITAIYEHSCENFLEIIRYCEANRLKSVEVKEAKADEFIAFVRERNQAGSFSSGCSSWFHTKTGENAAIFPGTFEELKQWRRFNPEQYHFERDENGGIQRNAECPDVQLAEEPRFSISDPVLQQMQKVLVGQDTLEKFGVLEKQLQLPEVGEMESLLAEMLVSSLISMDIVSRRGVNVEPWISDKQPIPFFERWLDNSVRYLQRQHWLDEALALNREVRSLTQLWREWEIQKGRWIANPVLKSQVTLVEVCLKALPGILGGRRLATDVIFPNASMALVEGIYQGNPLADYFNEILVETLSVCIEQKQADQIRILEIGAGTGGTTARLLPLLQSWSGSIAEYCYTDISKAFLKHAEKRYRPQFPALTTALFDVSKPLASQDINPDYYDVVIATNVLHATPDIRATLRHAKAALKHHGILLLNELSTWSLFNHLTFGLLDGWWLHEDSDLRLPGSPGLSPQTWQRVLSEEGFELIVFPASQAHKFGQQIIAAGLGGKQAQGAVAPSASLTSMAEGEGTKAEIPIPSGRQANREMLNSHEVTEQMMMDHIQRVITENLSAALEIDPDLIAYEASFADYGIDSILGVEFVQSVNAVLQVKLETTNLFDYSSVEKLSNYVLSVWGATLKAQLIQTPQVAEQTVGDHTPAPANEMTDLKRPVFDVDSKLQTNRTDDFNHEPIAIIGMSGRFAESESLEAFWQNLKDSKDLVKEVSRWDKAECVGAGSAETEYCSRGSFVDSIDLFDAGFFRISPLEAMYMDPQQRLFLEESWKALEHAGYAGKSMDGKRCGVFAGCTRSDYAALFSEEPPPQAFWGNAGSVIPARIAYYLNLQGPAISVDTACSSSLVSIHLACQSLWSRETEMALAGGIFLQLAPDYYQVSNRAGMLSPDGKCHAFDARANGFVPGEGVGVVVLKRLRDALQDGDSVHGVIVGSGTNQDGSTNGITAPSAQSQQRLELSVYERFNINPETIQLLEAHGTGTRLGDPVEFTALTNAFQQYTDKKQFCAIGSVKTNIGHATLAAGIAGVLKILMAVKHRQIPASLHFQEANPAIDFPSSPFYPSTQLSDWHVADGQPRRAAISSFGLSGTNAHMVIEEMPEARAAAIESPGYLVALSARTADQLKQQISNLLAFCQQTPDVSMNDMSHTLFVGRMHLSHRFACIARSQAELVQLLEQGLATAGKAARDSRVYSSVLTEGRVREQGSLKKYGNQCIQECKHTAGDVRYLEHLATIAELYVQGYELDFQELFARESKRIPLPTYPFARERHWVDVAPRPAKTALLTGVLHPLLHRNTSDLAQQRYSSVFSGEEFFLRDHQINGQKVLPAAAYLEMVRAAIMMALPDRPDSAVPELLDIVWLKPLTIAASKQVSIDLSVMPSSDGRDLVGFEVYSLEAEQRIVHSQGKAAFGHRPELSSTDIEHLQAEMKSGHLEAADIYAAFTGAGVNYGPAHRGIASIQFGDRQCLARLTLPSGVENDRQDYELHPSLMDSALQASINLLADASKVSNQISLPFALEALRELSPCTSEMLAWVRFAKGSEAKDKVAKLDIDLMDQDGRLCVQIQGLSFMALGAGLNTGMTSARIGSLLAVPAWEPRPVPAGKGSFDDHHVVLCEMPEIDPADLEARLPRSRCRQLQATQGHDIAERYSQHALACFEQVQSILKGRPRGKVLIQIVIPDHPAQTVLTGLSGLLKTAVLENPLICGQMIIIDPKAGTEYLADRLRENQAAPAGTVVRYQDSVRHVQRWQEMQSAQTDSRVVFRDQGVYLIIGGLGGLGMIFTREILRQVPNANVILTGRSPLTEEQRIRLEALSSRREAIDYRQLDLCNAEQVTGLIAAIEGQHKRLNGILHCAGMIADQFILNKTAEEFRHVLAPKVTGTWHLDQASRHLDLDFLVLFSSQAPAMGSMGQADYAVANGFMDQFAAYRNGLVADCERRGQTLSINWPLWQDGGMKADPAILRRIIENTGMHAMQTDTGLLSFYRSLGSGLAQIGVMEGDLPQIRELLFNEETPSRPAPVEEARPPMAAPVPSTLPAPDNLLEKTQDFLAKQLSALLKLPASRIDPQAPLEQYGIDSILTVNLTNQLEKTFGALSKTLLFEYQTIRELAEYFTTSHADKLAGLFAPADRQPAEKQKEGPTATAPISDAQTRAVPLSVSGRRPLQHNAPAAITRPPAAADEPIAIIGLSGRYPQAFNIDEYWQNLSDGKDCITEVPRERWDWREYFSDDRSQTGHHFSKWGGFIEGVDEFDPFFFNMSPREAEYTDPQERLFLQHAWMAVEDAGYTRAGLQIADEQDLAGQVGVYVGVMYGEYQLFGAEASLQGKRMGFAGSLASIANRVSYVLNLHGPSMTLDTMCSSSLTAIHLACQDLKQRRTSLAIAGGVNTTVHPNKYLMLSAGQFISSEGRCQSFGVGGDGYIPAEGVGVVVLKRLSDAQRDQDHIYGVIKGSALNHGGKTNGYTVPNPQAQTASIRRALAESGTNPRHISYIEAHGTGTKLGDPIEIAGLTKAFGQYTKDTGFCFVGSAKSNIGHGESAAGIAGLTKVLLQMKHRKIAPSLHSAVLNPNIDFDRTPFVVNQSLRDWENPVIDGQSIPRIAGISSFGAGGSNAHLILEEYLDSERDSRQALASHDAPSVIVLSAKNERRLREMAENLQAFIAENPALALSDVAYTLQVGREAMEERLGILANSTEQLSEKLGTWLAGEQDIDDLWQGQAKRNDETIALFTGDADLQETIDRWTAQGKYPKLLDLWVKGLNPDWNKLYGDDRPYRISLPAYPFARDRYWTPEGNVSASGSGQPSGQGSLLSKLQQSMTLKASQTVDEMTVIGAEAPDGLDDPSWDQLTYRPVWNEQPASQTVRRDRTLKHILLVYGESALQPEKDILAECRRRHPGANVTQIRLGRNTQRISDTEWSCDVDDPDGFHLCLKGKPTPDCVFFVAAVPETEPSADGDRPIQHSAVNEIQLLRLVKTLQQLNEAGTVADCFILTLDNHQPDDTQNEPDGGGLTGLAYAIAQGDRRFLVRNVDLSRGDLADDETRDAALKMMLDELPSDRGAAVKIKAGRRYQQSFLKWQWDLESQSPGLRAGGVYLIAGGSGTVGQIITRHLIERYRAKVVWLGRSAENDPSLQKKLASFQDPGTSPWYVQADVTQTDALRRAIDKVKQKYPVLNGAIFSSLVFHAENSVAGTTEQEFAGILDVKITGSRQFHAVLENEPLDFLCYFSSVQSFSFLSAKDSVGYATGITFADAAAKSQRHHSRFPVGIINWGYWEATVKGTPFEAPLSARFGLIQDRVGTRFFDRFISQLQKGGADQLLCMPASQHLQEMMGLRENEVSYLSSQANPSLFARLKEEYYEQA